MWSTHQLEVVHKNVMEPIVQMKAKRQPLLTAIQTRIDKILAANGVFMSLIIILVFILGTGPHLSCGQLEAPQEISAFECNRIFKKCTMKDMDCVASDLDKAKLLKGVTYRIDRFRFCDFWMGDYEKCIELQKLYWYYEFEQCALGGKMNGEVLLGGLCIVSIVYYFFNRYVLEIQALPLENLALCSKKLPMQK